jgi:hypothetical protein
MADASTIKEFFVSLGFRTDETSATRFRQGLGQAATATTALQKQIDLTVKSLLDLGTAFKKSAEEPFHKYEEGTRRVTTRQLDLLKITKDLGRTALETAAVFSAGILKVARDYEQLWLIAQRAGTTTESLARLQFASSQAGLGANAIAQGIDAISRSIAEQGQGVADWVNRLAGEDWEKAKDKTQAYFHMLDTLVDEYNKGNEATRPGILAQAQAIARINSDYFRQLAADNGRMLKEAEANEKEIARIRKEAGVDADQTATKSHALLTALGKAAAEFGIVWEQALNAVSPLLTPLINAFSSVFEWVLKLNQAQPLFAVIEAAGAALVGWQLLTSAVIGLGRQFRVIPAAANEATASVAKAGAAARISASWFGRLAGSLIKVGGLYSALNFANEASKLSPEELTPGSPEALKRGEATTKALDESTGGWFSTILGAPGRLHERLFGPSHQQGGIIEHTGPGFLHAGEMVLPEPISRGLQAMIRASQGIAADVGGSASRASEYLSQWLTGAGGAVPRIIIENVDDFVEQLIRAQKEESGGSSRGGYGGVPGLPTGYAGVPGAAGGPAGATVLPPSRTIGGTAGAAVGAGIGAVGKFIGTGTGKAQQLAGQAMQYFISQGWSHEQAAGIAASIKGESDFNPQLPGDRGLAYGIAQWHPDRQANFQKVMGKPIRESTFGEQLQFMQWELTNTEAPAGGRLRGAKTASEAGAAVSQFYERPRDVEGEKRRRAASAEQMMKIQLPDFSAASAQLDRISQTRLGGDRTTHNAHTVNEGDRNVTMNPTTNITINGGDGGAGSAHDGAARYAKASTRVYGDLIRNLKTAVA